MGGCVNRRGFLGLLSGAIASAAVGITLPTSEASKSRKLLHARHLMQYSIAHDSFVHRIDVKFVGPNGLEQWAVDCITNKPKMDPERELAPALATLNEALGRQGIAIGEIHSYSMDEWLGNLEARNAWDRIGRA